MKGTYEITIKGFDWGCCVTKAVLHLEEAVKDLKKEDLKITETKQITDFSKIPEFPIVIAEPERTVVDVQKKDEEGKIYEIDLGISPDEGSPLLFSMHTFFNTWSDPYSLNFEIKGKPVEAACTAHETDADIFAYDSYTASDGISLKYAYYKPETPSDRLVVWVHGLGEGGIDHTDPSITVLANKVTSLVSEECQTRVQGAHVLAPQCPTFWMDKDGTGSNLNHGAIDADEHSFYLNALEELIRKYQKDAGIKKTVIAGCSNGGYMTMLLAINFPDLADAYVPICEALADKCISDEAIGTLKELPMYFVYAEDDPTVDPSLHEIPTLARLKKAGADKIYVSTTEHVEDTSGKYKDKDGNPVRYSGHWSWIYFFNDECDADGLKAWTFIQKYLL